MKLIALASVVIVCCTGAVAAPLAASDCARIAAQVDAGNIPESLELAPLVRDGDAEVSGAARRLKALRAQVPPPAAALANATQDLRYQLQVCARR
jgi:hypothetical protein